MKIFASLAFSVMLISNASAQEVCAQKKKQYGKSLISCETVDWGIHPLSADYQPTNAAPMTALPGEVKSLRTGEYDYKNDYPGIQGTKAYFEGNFYGDPNKKGLPLAAKYVGAMTLKEGSESDRVKWLANDWYNSLQPQASAKGWEGKCENWSGWVMDPALQKLFSEVRDGLMCYGIPFTRGELKEIVTALYPAPDYLDRKGLQAFYLGYPGQRSGPVEDANVALSKLGLLGAGDFRPDQMVKMANEAKAKGTAFIMDKDAGKDIWNQPVKQVTDIAYEDRKGSEWESLSMSDFEPTDQSGVFGQLSLIEKEFTVGLIQGLGISESSSCTSRRLSKAVCAAFEGLSFSAQVEKWNTMKKTALDDGAIQLKQKLFLVKHELIIEYVDESSFASSKPDQTRTQTMAYVGVHSVDANGNIGSMVRSQWSPETRKMSAICKDQNIKGRVVSSLVASIDLESRCRDLQNGAPDSEVFVGALPPQNFKEFKPGPYFRAHQSKQQKAYSQFLEFLASCQNFDRAAQFLRDLDQAILDNDVSSEEARRLKAAYPAVKEMIDRDWITEWLNQRQSVRGLSALKQQLLL